MDTVKKDLQIIIERLSVEREMWGAEIIMIQNVLSRLQVIEDNNPVETMIDKLKNIKEIIEEALNDALYQKALEKKEMRETALKGEKE